MLKSLPGKNLLPDSIAQGLLGVERGEHGWTIRAQMRTASAACPGCGVLSHSRHSRYWRNLRDLPATGESVQLRLQVSRWRCKNHSCPRRIFSEPLPGVAATHAQETTRFQEIVELVGHQLGGRPGEVLLRRFGMPVSDDTLLRRIKQTAARQKPDPVRVVGVDDWAWRKGQSYGTILVDLERRSVIDLLPERSAESLAVWLRRHPEVTTISRDRHGLYADGAQRGAPQAIQVADRFHLIQNMLEMMEEEMSHLRRFLIIPEETPGKQPVAVTEHPVVAQPSYPYTTKQRTHFDLTRQAKLQLFDTVQNLYAQGMKVSEIIRRTGVCRHRVDKWVRLRELPERSRIAANPGMPGFYYGYLAKRWAEGCQNVRVLLREIRNLGYKGCYSWLARVLSPWRAETVKAPQSPVRRAADVATLTPSQRISPKVAASLLIKLPQALSARQRHTINHLKQNCPGFAKLRQLALGFRTILLRGTPTSLRDWMQRARQTGMPALNRFVKNLWRDFAAVSAAVTTSWSNGPIEGHINRLKVIKRHMYGRAGTELLRARLLPIPSQIANRVHQT